MGQPDDPDTLRSTEPRWPEVLEPPTLVQHECASCGLQVNARVIRTPEGLPDFLSVCWPEDAWIGWNHSSDEDAVRVLALCSQACLVEWFDEHHVPGA